MLNSGGVQNLQVGKYNVNIGQGEGIHIGFGIESSMPKQFEKSFGR
jgi:Effector-associated domain 10